MKDQRQGDIMKNVKDHYDAVSEKYNEQYDKNNLYDISRPYPANYFRKQLLLNTFVKYNVKRAIEIGVGEGTPLMGLKKIGVDVYGFDLSDKMIEKAKLNAKKHNVPEDHVFVGNIEDPNTYLHSISGGKFNGLVAMGVMPHVTNDEFVLSNMNNLLATGGVAFVEFRNILFSLFTFNRDTIDFVANDLLSESAQELTNNVKTDLEQRLRVDQPPIRKSLANNEPGYDAILSKFHNPLTIGGLFDKCGFEKTKLHFYHYHPSIPYLSKENPKLFRSETIKMENDTSGWKGYFLCSAFVVEAVKK